MEILTQDFYNRDTLTVARDLLGRHIVRRVQGRELICRISETEAYIGRSDKACHAYGYKRTKRSETLFAAPGTAYIYLIYGMYDCLNFVTEPEGEPAAVLIRCAEPVSDADVFSQIRFSCNFDEMTAYQRKNFMNGPGKLCRALCLSRGQNGLSLFGDELLVTQGKPAKAENVKTGKRIGIDYADEATDFLWRFTLSENA